MSATSPPIATPPASSGAQDERLVPISRLTRTLRRPELGSLLAAVFVFVMFAITDSSSNHLWLKQTGIAAWTTAGGVLRDRRGAGRAVDDRRRVRPFGRRDDRGDRDRDGAAGRQVAREHLDRDPHHDRVRHRDRADQRLHRRADEAAELHRHAGDVLRATRCEYRRRTAAEQREHADHRHHGAIRRA